MRLFSDQVRLLLDTYQAPSAKLGPSRAIEACVQAYRKIGSALPWSYLHRRTQVNTVAPYRTGAVAYTASTRTLTLTGGTWPTWAASAVLLIAGNVYAVQQRTSSTVLILQSGRCPVVDLAASTTYAIFQIEYVLPADFVRNEQLVPIGQWWALRERQPGSILETARLFSAPSRPFEYVIRGSLYSVGRMAMEFGPPPDAAYTLDLIYFAQPRPRTLSVEYKTGTVSVTNTSVVGVGTAFTQSMVGCRLRQGTASSAPVGEYGDNGSMIENTIVSVEDATHLTLLDSGGTSSGVQYLIDDPVDIERGAMDECFCRLCELQFEILSKMDNREAKTIEYRSALASARAMDVRTSPRNQDNGVWMPSMEALVYSGIRR